MLERVKIYSAEKFPYKIYPINIWWIDKLLLNYWVVKN
jgi:hypothetical protein